MEVDRDDPVRAGHRQEVRHQLGRNRLAGSGFPFLPGVAVIRNHQIDRPRAGPLGRIDHDQEFHQVLVDRMRKRLHQEHVAIADRFLVKAINFPALEAGQLDFAERLPELLADPPGQLRIRRTGENAQTVARHHVRPSRSIDHFHYT